MAGESDAIWTANQTRNDIRARSMIVRGGSLK